MIIFLPVGIFGAFLFLKACGLENNIYAQIALVMLIGLLGKNAVLMVEYAVQRKNAGERISQAAISAAIARFRPILMTSIAFIAGLIPLVFASGAGAIGNRTIGTAAVGGMIIGTLGGLLLIPGLYYIFAGMTDKLVHYQKDKPLSEEKDKRYKKKQKMKELMKTKSKLYYVITILVILMSIVACKTPQATMPQDTLKDSLPTLSKDSSVTISPAWREFFQDPMLQKLIETALQNNQDLKITLQELAIAKSAITAKQAALLPSVTANIGAGVSKVGRYTAEGAGNVGTEITPGHKIPTVIPDLGPSLQVDWTIDLWNKLNSGKKAAVERYLASEAGQRAIKSQLVADVAENYYLLLALDYKLSVMQQYISLQKDAVRIARIQKRS